MFAVLTGDDADVYEASLADAILDVFSATRDQSPPSFRSASSSALDLRSLGVSLRDEAAANDVSRFVVATEEDFRRLLRAISYLGHDPEHCLVIDPGSLSLVGSADASYAGHADGKSQSGCCIGFKGAGDKQDSYFIFYSGKQPIVTLSACESELVSACNCAGYLQWSALLFDGLGIAGPASVLYRNQDLSPYAHEEVSTPEMYQDNQATVHLIAKGRGNFKNIRHVKVRYYYVRDLVTAGELVVSWMSTVTMVADMLTKGVTLAIFCVLLPKLIGKR
jgi:hypothetical protein